MIDPTEGFQRGLMTGAQLGGRMRENRNAREIGGMLQSGDTEGAAKYAYGQGDLRTGQAINTMARQEAERERGSQIVGALRGGNYDQAMTFASSPEELQAITQFRENATEQELAEAATHAGRLVSVLESIQSLPPEQHFEAAQRFAPMFGLDPARLTPDMVTPQVLEGYRIQALGLKDYLTYRDRQADNERQADLADVQMEAYRALATQRHASANASNARAARAAGGSSGGGSRRSGGGSRPAAPAAPSRKPWERF